MAVAKDRFLSDLAAAAPQAQIIGNASEMEPFLADWRGRFDGSAIAVVAPREAAELAAIVRCAAEAGIGIVPQGGNTGLCGGATPAGASPSIIVRLGRMNRIRAVDPLGNTMAVEAGCILAKAQEAADEADRLLPMSLGSEGSCEIGGNISTNAGGTAVLRYGPMRDLVLGLEVVLPDGRIFDGMKALRKDNTGYDMKQVFIGAEGTLGIVTAAVLKLFAKPRQSATAIATVPDVASSLRLLAHLRSVCGETIAQYEIMSDAQVRMVEREIPGARLPLQGRSPWYQVVELADASSGAPLATTLETALAGALEQGLIGDAAVAGSKAQAAAIWRIRHSVSEANKKAGVSISHDTSVPLAALPRFVAEAEPRVQKIFPDAHCLFVGHVGDGNIHFIAHFPRDRFAPGEAFEEAAATVNSAVYDLVAELGGSISAEHGIGQTLRAKLPRYTDPVELDLMRGLKRLLDPRGIMNPGKVL